MKLIHKIGRRVRAFIVGWTLLSILVTMFPWAVVAAFCVGLLSMPTALVLLLLAPD